MIVFQLLFLALAGRQVVQFDARIRVAAISYAVFFLAVGVAFGDSLVPALAARALGGLLAAAWFWLLSRVGRFAFLVVAALCVAIPFSEFVAFHAVAGTFGADG